MSAVHYKCPYCGQVFSGGDLRDGLIPYHDFPKPCRVLCRGSGRKPLEGRVIGIKWKDIDKPWSPG